VKLRRLRGILLLAALIGAAAGVIMAARENRPAVASRAQTSPSPAPSANSVPTRQDAIEPGGITEHLRALARAAGKQRTRAAGTPGDRATAEYIIARLSAAGFRVHEQRFRVPLFIERSPARIAGLRRGRDFRTLRFSGAGSVRGKVRRIGLGCDRAAMRPLRRGEIALAQRGICTFETKARRARRAGAAAVLIAADSGDPFDGSLRHPVRIPVLALSESAGRRIGPRARLSVDADSGNRVTRNVIAETGPADVERVVMAGAHLDSVPEGPGLNDNGSGVAAVLEVAEQLAGRPLPAGASLRLGFWAAEEIGLVGSRRYVARLPRRERERIAAYLNLDMVGSPDARLAVYEGRDAEGRRIEEALRAELPRNAPEESLGGASDHASFDRGGIAVGGLFSGLDRCYHESCDGIRNVDEALAARAARATAEALLALAER
jgi:hypothetical protein